jgi:hypothetical protein
MLPKLIEETIEPEPTAVHGGEGIDVFENLCDGSSHMIWYRAIRALDNIP